MFCVGMVVGLRHLERGRRAAFSLGLPATDWRCVAAQHWHEGLQLRHVICVALRRIVQ